MSDFPIHLAYTKEILRKVMGMSKTRFQREFNQLDKKYHFEKMFPGYTKRSKIITKRHFVFCINEWGELPEEKLLDIQRFFSNRNGQPHNQIISNFGGDKYTQL